MTKPDYDMANMKYYCNQLCESGDSNEEENYQWYQWRHFYKSWQSWRETAVIEAANDSNNGGVAASREEAS